MFKSNEKKKNICIVPEDPRTQEFFLIGSPWPLMAMLGLYLYFVQDWGPSFMAKRKPFKLEKLIQIYNAMQIAICIFVLYKVIEYFSAKH